MYSKLVKLYKKVTKSAYQRKFIFSLLFKKIKKFKYCKLPYLTFQLIAPIFHSYIKPSIKTLKKKYIIQNEYQLY